MSRVEVFGTEVVEQKAEWKDLERSHRIRVEREVSRPSLIGKWGELVFGEEEWERIPGEGRPGGAGISVYGMSGGEPLRTEVFRRLGGDGSLERVLRWEPCGEREVEVYFDLVKGEEESAWGPMRGTSDDRLNILPRLGSGEWRAHPASLVRLDDARPDELELAAGGDISQEELELVTLSHRQEVGAWAGREVWLGVNLLLEHGPFGKPVSIRLDQWDAAGNKIAAMAVDPRWVTMELAEGHRVRLREAGRIDPRASELEVTLCFRLDTPENFFGCRPTREEAEVRLRVEGIRLVPVDRWQWNRLSLDRYERLPDSEGGGWAFPCFGPSRLIWSAASEGDVQRDDFNPDPMAVHWGPISGTLEFFLRPDWDADDGEEHLLYHGRSMRRVDHSVIRKLGEAGGNQLECEIRDANGGLHALRVDAPFQRGALHHIALTWDFERGSLGFYFDGKPLATNGPEDRPWPGSCDPNDPDVEGFSLARTGGNAGLDGRVPISYFRGKGMGLQDHDKRSLPFQMTLGGDPHCDSAHLNATVHDLRISDRVRYQEAFDPFGKRSECDEFTRAFFSLDGHAQGIHAGDDEVVKGHLIAPSPPRQSWVRVEHRDSEGKIHEIKWELYPMLPEMEHAAPPTDPMTLLPESIDFRFIEYVFREEEIGDEPVEIEVGGDTEPLMGWEEVDRRGGLPEPIQAPRLRANDQVVPFTFESLRETLPGKGLPEREKALALFEYAKQVSRYFDSRVQERFRDRVRDRLSYSLIRFLNICSVNQCGPLNGFLRSLFLAGGLSSVDWAGTHHQFQQVLIDGKLRFVDLSPRKYWLMRDGHTLLGIQNLERDPWLKIRTGSWIHSSIASRTDNLRFGSRPHLGITYPDERGKINHERFGGVRVPHRMEVNLRRGERLKFGWQNEGDWLRISRDGSPVHLSVEPPSYSNGRVIFEPSGFLVESESGEKMEEFVYPFYTPYLVSRVRVKASVRLDSGGQGVIRFRPHAGERWQECVECTEPGEFLLEYEFEEEVSNRHDYELCFGVAGGEISNVVVESVFVASPYSHPGQLRRGTNTVARFGDPVGEGEVRTRLAWWEPTRSDLGLSFDSFTWRPLEGVHENRFLFARPDEQGQVSVSLFGRPASGSLTLEGLPETWFPHGSSQAVSSEKGSTSQAEFTITPTDVEDGDWGIYPLTARFREERTGITRSCRAMLAVGDPSRRQLPLTTWATDCKELPDGVTTYEEHERSVPCALRFEHEATLEYDLPTIPGGEPVLWFLGRWESSADATLQVALGDGEFIPLEARVSRGLTTWDSPGHATARAYAQYAKVLDNQAWAWYRAALPIGTPTIVEPEGATTLRVKGMTGMSLSALLLASNHPATERTLLNLTQNWNFSLSEPKRIRHFPSA